MLVKILLLLCVWIMHNAGAQNISCTINFDISDEADDAKYLEFMDELENFTFNLADNCPDPITIDDLVWKYRFDLYEEYKDTMVECQCKDSEEEFLECMHDIRDGMTAAVVQKGTEIENDCQITSLVGVAGSKVFL